MLKILFTSVGRRVELMQAFKQASSLCETPIVLYGTDISDSAPALSYCDKTFITCRIKDQNYIPQLLQICEREKIDALIPTIDTDLLVLSQNKDKFFEIGTRVIVSDTDKIQICRDKRYTADYFHSVGLASPAPTDDYLAYDQGFPAFIKPKDGSSSLFAYKVEDAEALKTYAAQVPDYIIQPFIEGTEYTVDIFCDFEGNPIYITPRIRLAVRAGEVLKTQICQDETVIAEMKQLLKDYKPCGAITVQFIKQNTTGKNYYIEINPRFGGGAPITMKAGANSAVALLKLLLGEKTEYVPDAAFDGAVYSRFDQTACVSLQEQKIRAVIFDLDDTLYAEKEYVKSGYDAVGAASDIPALAEKLWVAFEKGLPAIDTVLEKAGKLSEKDRLLTVYRSHKPTLSLYKGAETLLKRLKAEGIQVGIITDGRPEGQRNKLEALGLYDLADEIIVTDELGGVRFRKPNDIAFRIMQCRMNVPFANMVYVGDNVHKDFNAPRTLGMQSVHFVNPEGLYFNGVQENTKSANSFAELEAILLKG